jgi:hypothetical protein
MIKSLILGKIDLTAMRAFTQEQGAVTDLVLEFRVF